MAWKRRRETPFTVQDYVDSQAQRAAVAPAESVRTQQLREVKHTLAVLTNLALSGRIAHQTVHVMRDPRPTEMLKARPIILNNQCCSVVEATRLVGWSLSQAILRPLEPGMAYPPGSVLVMQEGYVTHCTDVQGHPPGDRQAEVYIHVDSLGHIDTDGPIQLPVLQENLQTLLPWPPQSSVEL